MCRTNIRSINRTSWVSKKQIIAVLTASMLTKKSNADARDAYYRIINSLDNEIWNIIVIISMI